MWGRKLEQGNTESFENLTTFSKTNKLTESTMIPCFLEHISALRGHFQKYFPDNSVQFDWVRDPFTAPAPDDLSSSEEEEFIEMTSDSNMMLKFPSQTLFEFWLGVEREFPLIGQKAVENLYPFGTSYLCKTGFSAVALLKTKYRSRFNIEHYLTVAISKLLPRFEQICSEKQALCSHRMY